MMGDANRPELNCILFTAVYRVDISSTGVNRTYPNFQLANGKDSAEFVIQVRLMYLDPHQSGRFLRRLVHTPWEVAPSEAWGRRDGNMSRPATRPPSIIRWSGRTLPLLGGGGDYSLPGSGAKQGRGSRQAAWAFRLHLRLALG